MPEEVVTGSLEASEGKLAVMVYVRSAPNRHRRVPLFYHSYRLQEVPLSPPAAQPSQSLEVWVIQNAQNMQ
jgi:hypothetical protein